MVDKAAVKLKKSGIYSALINAGGDIYGLGGNNGRPWTIGIRNPENREKIIDIIEINDEAAATSGTYEQFFTRKENNQNRVYSHLIDPRSGDPVDNNILSVTVAAKNTTTADSLATAFAVMGIDGIKNFLSANPTTLKIYVLTRENGKINLRIFK